MQRVRLPLCFINLLKIKILYTYSLFSYANNRFNWLKSFLNSKMPEKNMIYNMLINNILESFEG